MRKGKIGEVLSRERFTAALCHIDLSQAVDLTMNLRHVCT
jgi:hypothetical protein